MKRIKRSSLAVPAALVLLASGCSSLGDGLGRVPAAVTGSGERTSGEAAANGRAETDDAVGSVGVSEASVPASAATGERGARARRVDVERDARVERLWRDADFQRRLQLSYLPLSEVEPEPTLNEKEELAKIVALVSEGEAGIAEARELVERMRTPASSAVVHFWHGMIALQQSDFEVAERAFSRAVDAYPRYLRAWQRLALVQAQLSDFESAVHSFSQVIQLGQPSADDWGLLGVAHQNVGDFVAAESAYRMAALLAPKSFDWKVGLAESLSRQGRHRDAVAQFDALIAMRPSMFELWLGQADAYLKQREFDKAAENLEFVDELGGSTAATMQLLGDLYVQQQLFEPAADAYVRAVDLDPEAGARIGIEAAKGLAGRNANAAARRIVAHVQARGGDPLEGQTGVDLLRLRATLARSEGDREGERAVLEELVHLDPLDGWALIQLGELLELERRYEEATIQFERASDMDGYTAAAQLSLGRMLVRQGEYAAGLAALRASSRAEPSDALTEFIEQVERAARSAQR